MDYYDEKVRVRDIRSCCGQRHIFVLVSSLESYEINRTKEKKRARVMLSLSCRVEQIQPPLDLWIDPLHAFSHIFFKQ